jgi:predicted DNA-binding antitoxin AbrB/MazE fold protein
VGLLFLRYINSLMLTTVRAIMKEGKLTLLEPLDIPEGTEVLVTPLLDEADFYLKASESSLGKIWDNEEDDIYAELLST